jgi:hypothetical protein
MEASAHSHSEESRQGSNCWCYSAQLSWYGSLLVEVELFIRLCSASFPSSGPNNCGSFQFKAVVSRPFLPKSKNHPRLHPLFFSILMANSPGQSFKLQT